MNTVTSFGQHLGCVATLDILYVLIGLLVGSLNHWSSPRHSPLCHKHEVVYNWNNVVAPWGSFKFILNNNTLTYSFELVLAREDKASAELWVPPHWPVIAMRVAVLLDRAKIHEGEERGLWIIQVVAVEQDIIYFQIKMQKPLLMQTFDYCELYIISLEVYYQLNSYLAQSLDAEGFSPVLDEFINTAP